MASTTELNAGLAELVRCLQSVAKVLKSFPLTAPNRQNSRGTF